MAMDYIHYSVMKQEALQWLEPSKANGLMVDGTLGEGGHSLAFLEAFPQLRVIGLDADEEIQKKARKRLESFGDRMEFRNTWFNDFFANYHGEPLHRILLDLGISIFHYQESERGFSFSKDESLDMRLNPGEGESAAQVVNGWEEKALADAIYQFGEERYSRRIASAIVANRPYESASQLAEVIYKAVPGPYRRGRIHPATRTFQALRIVVNRELERLDQVMEDAFNALEVGGRLGIITFHSLEDRAVKQYFRKLHQECLCEPNAIRCTCGDQHRGRLCFRKPLLPTEQEIAENSPSRSAKFRVIEKLEIQELPS